MHYLVSLLDRFRLRDLRYQFVPWYRVGKDGQYRDLTSSQRVELEKIIAFDALTPMYDNPISTNSLVEAFEQNEIEVTKLEDRRVSPVYATVRNKRN